MAFPTDDIFLGPPTYGLRKGTAGVVLHTTEGAGTSRDAALATARWQRDTGNSSYNFIVYDGGVLLTVPYLEASGSLTLKRTNPPWAPERYPWIRTMLGEAAYADPNAYLVAISLSGKTGEFVANGYPPNMVETTARLIKWIEDQAWGNDNLVLTNHYHWQTDRSDPGVPFMDLVLARYAALLTPPAPAPAPTPAPPPTAEQELVLCQAELTSIKAQLANKNAELASAKSDLVSATARIASLEGVIEGYVKSLDALRTEAGS